MRVFLLAVAVISPPVWAEWTLVGGDDAARSSTYADIATIRKQDGSTTIWTLVDFKTARRAPYGPEYSSQKIQREFDCNGRRVRALNVAMHAGQMGAEDVVSTHEDPGEWEPVATASAGEALWKIACRKP